MTLTYPYNLCRLTHDNKVLLSFSYDSVPVPDLEQNAFVLANKVDAYVF